MIGNEIPPDIVRWYGPRRIEQFLGALRAEVKAIAPAALVSYANFPPTEYLDLGEIDFVCFNVYLHDEEAFRRYLGRLQNLAGDRPLVLTEHGIDSHRLGAATQAEILGVAGARGVRLRRRRHLRLLVDGRLVHRRTADRRLGVRARDPRPQAQARLPHGAGRVQRRPAAAAAPLPDACRW